MNVASRTGLAALVAVLLAGCGFSGLRQLPLPGGPDVGDDSYVVTARFDDVLNLTRQSTVRAEGVVVGRVEEIGRSGWDAEVRLRLRADVPLPADVTARVAQTSLLGEKFVDLVVPEDSTGTARLAAGDVIGIDRTGHGAEVEEVLGALSLLLNGGGIAELQTVSREMHAALDSGSVDTSRFLRQLDTFVAALDRNQDSIVSALESVDRLSRQVSDGRETIRGALRDIPDGLRELADTEKELTAMLRSLDRFSAVGSDVLERSAADLEADLAALRPVLAQLEASGDTVPEAIETILSFPFPDEVLDAIHGDYVNLAVRLDLSALEIITDVSGGLIDVDGHDDPAPLPEQSSTSLPALPALPRDGGGLLELLLGGLR